MAISKQLLKTKPEWKITFTLSAEESGNAETVVLAGGFNNWDLGATPMKKRKDGSFGITRTFPVGEAVTFRYVADGDRWLNDAQADAYEYCSFATGENSVLHL